MTESGLPAEAKSDQGQLTLSLLGKSVKTLAPGLYTNTSEVVTHHGCRGLL